MNEVIMPDEFNFISNINTLTTGLIYQAKKVNNKFVITWDLNGKCEEKITKVYHYLKHRDWVIQ